MGYTNKKEKKNVERVTQTFYKTIHSSLNIGNFEDCSVPILAVLGK